MNFNIMGLESIRQPKHPCSCLQPGMLICRKKTTSVVHTLQRSNYHPVPRGLIKERADVRQSQGSVPLFPHRDTLYTLYTLHIHISTDYCFFFRDANGILPASATYRCSYLSFQHACGHACITFTHQPCSRRAHHASKPSAQLWCTQLLHSPVNHRHMSSSKQSHCSTPTCRCRI
jgi:hypothetical protein